MFWHAWDTAFEIFYLKATQCKNKFRAKIFVLSLSSERRNNQLNNDVFWSGSSPFISAMYNKPANMPPTGWHQGEGLIWFFIERDGSIHVFSFLEAFCLRSNPVFFPTIFSSFCDQYPVQLLTFFFFLCCQTEWLGHNYHWNQREPERTLWKRWKSGGFEARRNSRVQI